MAADTLKSKLKAINPDGAYRAVGRVKDAHGLKGEIWVVLFAGEADWLESLRETGGFLLASQEDVSSEAEVKSSTTEYPLKGVRIHKNGLILQSQIIADRTAAEKLRGQFLIIPDSYLEAEEGEEFYLSEVEGFKVVEAGKTLGTVVGFSSNVAQDLLIVELEKEARPGVKEGAEIEIPFVEALVVGVDVDSESLEVELPGGLIEVQLGLDQQEKDEPDEDASEAELFGDEE